MQPLKHRDTASRSKQSDPRILQAKGLGLELKNQLKTKDPWNREVEFQRDATRKAYLKIIFSSPSLTSSSLALLSSTRSSSNLASNSTSLEALNLLWLETTHALIAIYRQKLSKMDKQIAENPKPPSRRSADKRGGNDGNIQYAHPPALGGGGGNGTPVVGPVARRKLLQQFQKFLNGEQEFWKIIVNRLASRLTPSEQVELRPLGIIATRYDDTNTSSQPEEEEVSEEEKKRRRLEVLPLVHKTLICFGDLARYIEYNSDSPTPAPATAGGSKGGRNRGGKKNETAGRTTSVAKSYTKAAECYRQANLLLPDDGNSHNQLAVLAQYAADPLASTYHYYRALTVRLPFATAIKNLEIAYSKALQRYNFDFERRRGIDLDGREIDRVSEVKRFREVFMTLHGIFFTKTKLHELNSMLSRVDKMFQLCTRERLITSDGVLKIVVTSLAALWHARLTRSKALNDNSTLNVSRSKSTSLAPVDSAAALPSSKIDNESPSSGVKLEAHILVHVLQLYTTLLATSSAETNELFTSNLDNSSGPGEGDHEATSLDANISAVLRRSVPALRILGRWLKGHMDYIERLEKRVIEKEKRRLRAKTRTSGGTSSMEEAQRSLESSGGTTSDDSVMSSQVLESTLDAFWNAFADYSNSIKLAFPKEDARLPVLDEGVWLEEDVECLGFAPLRRKLAGIGDTREGARRVGRDVHPNQEVLMRVEEAQRLAEEVVDSPFSRLALIDGAYVFVPQEEPQLDEGAEEQEPRKDEEMKQQEVVGEEEEEEDIEMRDQSTEDDPIDRAMRTAANQLDLDGVEEEDEDEDEDEDSDGEQIVFSGSRNSSQPAVPRQAPAQPSPPPNFPPRQGSFSTRDANRSSPLTAADLRQQLFAPTAPIAPLPVATPPTHSSPQPPPAANFGSPSLRATTSAGPSSPHALASIWGAPPPAPSAHLPHLSSSLRGPSLVPPQHPHQGMTAHSFEAIPNLTHDSFAAHQLGWGAPGQPSTSSTLPPPPHSAAQPPAIPPAQLFGGHEAFSLPPSQPQARIQPLPQFPNNQDQFSRSFSLPPNAPSAPPVQHSHSQPAPLFAPPGLSTAHVGLNPAPPLPRIPSNGSGGGFGFPLPKPTGGGTGAGVGGWPTHLGGNRGS
ncbi:hypothetical protein JCM3765_005107 [Sporobolomyces pararoseus]